MTDSSGRALLDAAGDLAGVRTDGAELIRDGSNLLYRLPDDVVARVGQAGREATARREAAVARWLAEAGVPAIRPAAVVDQPTVVDDRPVTWWELLPQHRSATPAELGRVLRSLHALPIPDALGLPELDPFEGLAGRIENAEVLDADDRTWLDQHLDRLRTAYASLPPGLPRSVLHGDSWQGNLMVPDDGTPVLLDFEHVSIGRPEWDLVPLAADFVDFARIDEAEYRSFADAYGSDVTTWGGFRVLADIVELRWTCFVLGKADGEPDAERELRHRLACLRGDVGKPWSWSAF